MGLGKILKKVAKIAVPLAATYFAPGVGSAIAGGLGLGAIGPAATAAIGGGALGAAGGALTGGGLKGALLSGAAGAAGGYLSNGGLSQLGITGPGGILGESAGAPLSGGAQGPTQGSGLLGSITRGLSNSGVTGAVGAGGGSGYSGIANAVGGLSSLNANDDAEKFQLDAQKKRLALYQPYVDAKFEPGDLTQDPGYQFRKSEGEAAINRSLGARGKIFSGEALKAAQDYGQGLADSTFNEAYNRWLQQNGQNIGVADRASGIYDSEGDISANAAVSKSNSLKNLLSGYGAYSDSTRPKRFDPYTGQPLY